MINRDKNAEYQLRYIKITQNLKQISEMKPKEKYIWRLMDTVIFQDFETALDVMIEDFKASNDNTHKSLP